MTSDHQNSKLGRHIVAYFLASALPAAFSFVSLMIFTRWLSPDDYGLYQLIYATSLLLMSLLYGGFSLGVLRFWPAQQSENERREFLASMLFITFLLVLGMLLVTGVATALLSQYRELLWLGFFLYVTHMWFQLDLDLFRTTGNARSYLYMRCSRAFLCLCVAVLFLYFGWGVTGVLASFVVGNVLAVLAFRKRAIIRASHWRWRLVNRLHLKTLASYSVPIAFTFALNYLIGNTDRWLLAKLSSLRDAGLYSAAYNLPLQTLAILMAVVNLAGYPIVVKAYETGGAVSADKPIRNLYIGFLTIVLPACLGLLLLTSNVVHVILGREYHEVAMRILPIIIATSFVSGLRSYYLDMSFHLTNSTKMLFYVSVLIAVVNLVLNVTLIPRYGIDGAVMASAVAFLAGLAASLFAGRRLLPLPLLTTDVYRLCVPLLALGAVLYPTAQWRGAGALVAQVTLGAAAYVLAHLLVNRRWLLEMRGRLR